MTAFDEALIEKANNLNRFDYRKIEEMMDKAETQEACTALYYIMQELRDLVIETI